VYLLLICSAHKVEGQHPDPDCPTPDCTHTAVESFTLGEDATFSVSGDTKDGCRFLTQNPEESFSCCFSAQQRGDDLCDPNRQDGRCRGKDTFKVEEREGSCVILLKKFNVTDVGSYHAIFPGKLADNKWTKVKLKEKAAELNTSVLAIVLVILVLLVVVLVIFRRKLTGIHCSNGREREKNEEKREGNIKICQETTDGGGKDRNLELGIIGKQDTRRTRQIKELTKTVEDMKAEKVELTKTVEEIKAENVELTKTVEEFKGEMAAYKRLSKVSQQSMTSLQEAQMTSVEFCPDENPTDFQSSYTRPLLSTSTSETKSHPRTNKTSKPYNQSHSYPSSHPPTHHPTKPPTHLPKKPPTHPPTHHPSPTADKRPPSLPYVTATSGTNNSKPTLPIKPTQPTKPTWVEARKALIKSPNQPSLDQTLPTHPAN